MDSRTPRDAPPVPSMEQLIALAERCEREQPSVELDALIFAAITQGVGTGAAIHNALYRDESPATPVQIARAWDIRGYTTRIDDALSLVPDLTKYAWNVRGNPVECKADVGLMNWRDHEGRGCTPALALCAAALRARAEQTQAPEPRGDAHPNHGAP